MEIIARLANLPGALPGACAQGLIWGIMAIGVYLTYRILDVADLTVDGSFGTGGAVCVMCLLSGMNVWAALLVAVLAGLATGLVTGLLVDEVQKYLEAKGVTATQYAFSDSNDLSSVCQKAADENDALYVPTDNTVAANTGIVDGICRPAKKPVFAGEEGICSGCGVATLSISYYDLGYTTGEMAVKILNGESDISTMPIEYTDVTKKYNKAVCDDLGLTVPEGYVEIEA